MEWKPFQASLEKAKKRGADIPALDDIAEPYDDLADIWRAFFELCASRTAGQMSMNPIQPTNIVAWLDMSGVIDIEERRRYYELITILDVNYLKHHMNKSKDQDG